MLQRLSHLLGTENLTREQIAFILDQAKPFQEFQRHPLKKLGTLRGKTVAIAFFESSTRTRISFTTAALGGSVEVPTLNGEVVLKIPSETQSGRVFRVREKGVKPVRGGAASPETPASRSAFLCRARWVRSRPPGSAPSSAR